MGKSTSRQLFQYSQLNHRLNFSLNWAQVKPQPQKEMQCNVIPGPVLNTKGTSTVIKTESLCLFIF